MQTSLGLQGSWLAALWGDSGCNWNPISGLILREVSATELAPMLAGEDGDLDGTCLSLGHVPSPDCGQTGALLPTPTSHGGTFR